MTTYGPGQGPAPTPLSDDEVSELIGKTAFGTLATVKRSGHPHMSTVVFSWDEAGRIVRISTTADRLKVRQLRNDPRAALYASSEDFLSFAVAEGTAELSEVASEPGDAVSRELLDMLGGSLNPEDAPAFLEQMVKDRRVVIRLHVERLYGTSLAK
ncbi:PPOX class F420-dependent oxidoreductase [Actinomadura harenae]|uniref:PPOX class F420-dependent oxidoreductase n=1 Tax=Actinomadura harenae TaxID=2483351 RepID=A0A3M2M1A5_9ACTN|nr:PPOX class F420-dependent oxidoreductase [Actinomadura harenae]RMI43459.1 PPOX class F420-dependent oxidoreductase [Actinomadura harenae]